MSDHKLPQWPTTQPSSKGPIYLGILHVARKRIAWMIICIIVVGSMFRAHEALPHAFRHNSTADIYNGTLGFERLFAIGFEGRTDKRDARKLASALTGFAIEWLPGVSSADIPEKAVPPTWDTEEQSSGSLGCWRAHMDVVAKVVAENIQTALILEDDADWDVNIKEQLVEFAKGSKALQGHNSPLSPISPYGDDWDVLWVGHCRAGSAWEDEQDMWVIDDDLTVPTTNHRHANWRNDWLPEPVQRNGTRVVLKTHGGMCMYGYAISQRGARKILAALSVQSQNMPVDVGMSALCRERSVKPFKCYAPYPPLFASHRPAGPSSRDSDIRNKDNKWHDAFSFDIVYSTAMNILRLVEGKQYVDAQWPDAEFTRIPYGLEARDLWQPGYLQRVDNRNPVNNEAKPSITT
ncbi:hypothetical protein LTR84_006715 [Exophiala bonariae]|uniref:Glycosyl transferase family 25 domain-containing protein n=1 Tax=Exophiala bonariae TaxID=1690606 RepID=A0AAV9MZR7_9EURO|nr:hypothetical protein LTR84_006715 [Exophiala bonariae]